MSDSVNRVQVGASLHQSGSVDEVGGTFFPEHSLKLVVNSGSEFKLASPEQALSPKMHQEARKMVFERIVTSHLKNPNHPYYPMVTQAMLDAITDALASSHYFQQSLKRA